MTGCEVATALQRVYLLRRQGDRIRSLTRARPARGALFSFLAPFCWFQFRRFCRCLIRFRYRETSQHTVFNHEIAKKSRSLSVANRCTTSCLPPSIASQKLLLTACFGRGETRPKKIDLAEEQSRYDADLAPATCRWRDSGGRSWTPLQIRISFQDRTFMRDLGTALPSAFRFFDHDVHSARSCFAEACSTT